MTRQIVSQKEDSTQAQTDRLLAYLKNGRTISPIEAWNELGIYQLADRVFDLRQSGVNINGNTIVVTNKYGEPCRVKEYWMVDGDSEVTE